MNRGPYIFLGVFFALILSWAGLLVQPQLQLGLSQPETNIVNTAELYPQARPGLAQQGLQVYRSLGCATCHSQQIRQTGAIFNVALLSAGTNQTELLKALRKVNPAVEITEAAELEKYLPAVVLEGVDKSRADLVVTNLSVGGAKARALMNALGPDIARGWGAGRSVAADYLHDQPAMLGSQRIGPDLSNVGQRLGVAQWHFDHLYNPTSLVPKSVMPPYRFLFELRKKGDQPTPNVVKPAAGVPGGFELVPTDDARALVAYLISLRSDVPLFARPVTMPLPKPEVPATNAVSSASPTNAPAK